MSYYKIGGVPVMSGSQIVGLITETDLFKLFLELMGARQNGVRVTALVPDRAGELAVLTRAVFDAGGDFIAFGLFAGDKSSNRTLTFKIRNLTEEAVRESITPFIEELIDIRTCCD
jgi:acetoin utilization protein AcuB